MRFTTCRPGGGSAVERDRRQGSPGNEVGAWKMVSCFVTSRELVVLFLGVFPGRGVRGGHTGPFWEAAPCKLASVTGARWPAREGERRLDRVYVSHRITY